MGNLEPINMKFTTAIAVLLSSYATAKVPSLTPANYDSMTDGKTVFIKFFAPWCGHCKKMAPDWEKLSDEWEGNETGLVAEVDCTAEGKPLCEMNSVKGFPTLKWGDPSSLDDYQGGRTYTDLANFAKKNLKPICSPTNIDLCDADKKALIEKYMAMESSELQKLVEEEETKIKGAEDHFSSEVQKLQDKYQSLMDEKEKIIAEVTASGLGLMKSVTAQKAKAGVKEEL